MKNKFMITALILALTATASLTACGGNTTTGGTNNGGNNGSGSTEKVTDTTDKNDSNKETDKNIADDIESGVEDIGSDIKDSITNPEDATHGTTRPEQSTEEETGMQKHRTMIPYGTK